MSMDQVYVKHACEGVGVCVCVRVSLCVHVCMYLCVSVCVCCVGAHKGTRLGLLLCRYLFYSQMTESLTETGIGLPASKL